MRRATWDDDGEESINAVEYIVAIQNMNQCIYTLGDGDGDGDGTEWKPARMRWMDQNGRNQIMGWKAAGKSLSRMWTRLWHLKGRGLYFDRKAFCMHRFEMDRSGTETASSIQTVSLHRYFSIAVTDLGVYLPCTPGFPLAADRQSKTFLRMIIAPPHLSSFIFHHDPYSSHDRPSVCCAQLDTNLASCGILNPES